jgi:hypothetical protein
MNRKSGYRFSEKISLNKRIERDDDPKKSHPALARTGVRRWQRGGNSPTDCPLRRQGRPCREGRERLGWAPQPWVDPRRRRDLPSWISTPIDLRPIQPWIATISPARHLKRFATDTAQAAFGGRLWRADNPRRLKRYQHNLERNETYNEDRIIIPALSSSRDEGLDSARLRH